MEDYGFMELEQKKAFLIKFCYWGVIALCTLKCIVSYGLIFLITFIELWAGLAIIKVPYAMTAAVVIAVLDILPVLGAGSVLIPWGIFAALNGDFKMAVDNEYLTIENILSFPINSVTLAVLLVLLSV